MSKYPFHLVNASVSTRIWRCNFPTCKVGKILQSSNTCHGHFWPRNMTCTKTYLLALRKLRDNTLEYFYFMFGKIPAPQPLYVVYYSNLVSRHCVVCMCVLTYILWGLQGIICKTMTLLMQDTKYPMMTQHYSIQETKLTTFTLTTR